jgi:hypothetical protein
LHRQTKKIITNKRQAEMPASKNKEI